MLPLIVIKGCYNVWLRAREKRTINLLNYRIALAHNGLQNGDVMADPDVEVRIYPDQKIAEALTFQNDYLGIYQEVYDGEKCNNKLKRELNIFLDDWLANILDSGYELAEKEE